MTDKSDKLINVKNPAERKAIGCNWLAKCTPNIRKERGRTQTPLHSSKRSLFSGRHSHAGDHWHPRIVSERLPESTESELQEHVVTVIDWLWVLNLFKLSFRQLAHASVQSSLAWFFNDFLCVLHVFDNREQCILTSSSFHFDEFFDWLSRLCPRD